MPVYALVVAVAAYAAATFGIWRHLRAAVPTWPAQTAAATALLLHILVLAHLMLRTHAVVIGLGGALSLFTWQTALLLFLISLRQPTLVLGLVVYPLAAASAVAGVLLPDSNRATEALDTPLQIHVLLSLVAYGVLTLGAVQALVLAMQHRQLHDHQPRGLVAALPPLQSMERLLFRLIGAGFALLTLALVSGALFVDNLFTQHLLQKTVLSLVAWLFFGVLLWGRWRYGWRGRMAVRWTLAGYATLILAYFGSKLVLELILGEHWSA